MTKYFDSKFTDALVKAKKAVQNLIAGVIPAVL